MSIRLLLVGTALTCLVAIQLHAVDAPMIDAPVAEETETSATLEQLKQDREREVRQEAAELPMLGTFTLRQVLQFELEEGFLVLKTELPDTADLSRISIEGLTGVTTVQVQRRPEQLGPDIPFAFKLIHQDFSSPDHIQIQSAVFYHPTSLNAARDVVSPTEIVSTQLIQLLTMPPGLPGAEDPVRLFVRGHSTVTEESTVSFRADAPTFVDLHRRHPREVAQYLQPLLRDLGQGHLFAVDSRVAWQVFPELFEPGAELQRQLEQIIPRLDVADFQQREQASQDLEQLGQPGALLLMSMNRRGLSAEQNARIEAFLEPYRPLSPEQARDLREDSSFLLDLLLRDERVFREAALRQLRGLHEHADIEFDLDAEPEERAAQVRRLRQQLGTTDDPTEDAAEPAGYQQSLEGLKWDARDR